MPHIALPITDDDNPQISGEKLATGTRYRQIIAITSRIIVISILIAAALIVFHPGPFRTSYLTTPAASLASSSGWHSRAQLMTTRFDPDQHTIVLGALTNSAVEYDGFIAGLYSPNIVVDAQGVPLKLDQRDWDRIVDLALKAVNDLPNTGNFRNQWRIAHNMTGFAVDYVRVKPGGSGAFKEVGVYGFDGSSELLEEPVGDYKVLPQVLKELFGLLSEARDGYKHGRNDEPLVNRVKATLQG